MQHDFQICFTCTNLRTLTGLRKAGSPPSVLGVRWALSLLGPVPPGHHASLIITVGSLHSQQTQFFGGILPNERSGTFPPSFFFNQLSKNDSAWCLFAFSSCLETAFFSDSSQLFSSLAAMRNGSLLLGPRGTAISCQPVPQQPTLGPHTNHFAKMMGY